MFYSFFHTFFICLMNIENSQNWFEKKRSRFFKYRVRDRIFRRFFLGFLSIVKVTFFQGKVPEKSFRSSFASQGRGRGGSRGRDIIWYDIIWYYIISYDIIWCDMISYDIIGYDIIWYVMISHDIIWYEFMLYDIIWYYMTWFDKLRCTFWTCSGHVPKKFGGSKMKFFQKVLGTFGLCFGIIPGV